MQSLKSVLSDLKLRASYGVNGNLPSSYYGYQSTYTTGAFYNGKPSPWESTLGNEELTWEKNYALNLGLDIGFFGLVHAYNERFIDEQAIEFHQRFFFSADQCGTDAEYRCGT